MAELKKVSTAPAKTEDKAVVLNKDEAPKAKIAQVVKKTTAKKEAAEKKPVAKKATAKATTKATTKEEKTSIKTTATKKTEIIKFEFNNKSYMPEDLLKSAKDVWQFDFGKKASELNSVELYVKPEEEKVYYVFNNDISGSFNI